MTLPTTILGDDHAILIDGLCRLLEGHAKVIATCSDGAALLDATMRLRPELVITDISMPVMTGLEFLRNTRTMGYRPRVIVLCMYGDEQVVSSAFRNGAMAYLPKHGAGEELLDAVREVMAGRHYVSRLLQLNPPCPDARPRRAGSATKGTPLSPRQQEVLRLVASGKTMKEIAAELKLSRRTVEMHKYQTMKTLGVGTTAELIQYFVRHQVVSGFLEEPIER